MIVGIPTEVKTHEYRVAATPEGVRELVHAGHEVVVQAGAGAGSAITDDDFVAAGGRIVPDADAVFEAAGADREGEGAAARGVRTVPRRPRLVHLPASGGRCRG